MFFNVQLDPATANDESIVILLFSVNCGVYNDLLTNFIPMFAML